MKNGLIFGFLAGILYLVWVVIGGSMFPYLTYGTLPATIISLLVVITFSVLACRKEKVDMASSLRFGEAFLVCLITYAIFSLIYGIGFKIYVELSPAAMASFLEFTKASTIDLWTKMGLPEDELFKNLEEFEAGLPNYFSWKATFLSIFGGLIFPGALVAVIVAAIFSKFLNKQPVV